WSAWASPRTTPTPCSGAIRNRPIGHCTVERKRLSPPPDAPGRQVGTARQEANMTEQRADTLDVYRRNAELTRSELWLRYFELGGMCTAFQVEAFLYGALQPSPHDHDVIAQALNERFVELGGDH